MSEQLQLEFNRYSALSVPQAVDIYWELEGKALPGKSHWYDCCRIKEGLAAKHLHEVTSYDVRQYLENRRRDALVKKGRTLKDSTLNREHSRITRIFNAYKGWRRECRSGGKVSIYDFSDLQLPEENPGELVPRKNERHLRRNRVLSKEEFGMWLDFAHPRVRRIATLAILTLLRRKDIELLNNDNFNKALSYLDGVQSKTGVEYHVPATMTVRVIFHEAKQEEKNYVCDFTNFRRLFSRACKESDIWFQFKDLRRTGATHLLLEGVDLRTIQKYLGHASLAMTENYLAPPERIQRAAGAKLEEFIMKKPNIDFTYSEN